MFLHAATSAEALDSASEARRREAGTHELLTACLDSAAEQGFQGVVRDSLRQGLIPQTEEQGNLTTLVAFAVYSLEPGQATRMVPDSRVQPTLTRALGRLGDAAFQTAWDSGRAMTVPDGLAARLWICRDTARESLTGLTPREREVLALVAQGLPDRKVAQRLDISPGTVSKHVAKLLGKLGLHNRVELARWAIEHGAPEGRAGGHRTARP